MDSFNRGEWYSRHRIEVATPSKGKAGYITRVIETRVTESTRKPSEHVVFNSELEHRELGIFPKKAQARNVGDRWMAAKCDQIVRIAELRELRRDELPDKLTAVAEVQAELNAEIRELRKKLKQADEKHDGLIREARNPRVEMTFQPSAEDFTIFDEVSYSAGTINDEGVPTEDPRQGKLLDENDQPVERGSESDAGDETDENLIEFGELNVKQARNAIRKCEDPERLEAWKAVEEGRKTPRSSVLNVIADRVEKLKKKAAEAANDSPPTTAAAPIRGPRRPGVDPSRVQWPEGDSGKDGDRPI